MTVLVNQRTMLETSSIEMKLAALEAAIKTEDDNNIVPFKKRHG